MIIVGFYDSSGDKSDVSVTNFGNNFIGARNIVGGDVDSIRGYIGSVVNGSSSSDDDRNPSGGDDYKSGDSRRWRKKKMKKVK